MGLFSNSKPARTALKDARKELERTTNDLVKKHGKGKAPETDGYLKANKRVADAEKDVPWYLR
jgi:hypothetical protein